MRKFKLVVSTGYAGCIHKKEYELDDEYIKGKTEEEIQELVQEVALEFMHERIEVGFEELPNE